MGNFTRDTIYTSNLAWISKHLGMDRDEILRLKQITGLAALFRDVKFGKAWQPAEDELD